MFNNKFQEKIYRACIIITIFGLFLAIMYQIIFNMLHVSVEKYNDKLKDITHSVELGIAGTNQAMYALSIVLSSERIEKNNSRIDDLLDKYVAWHIYKTAPFHSLRIWGINDEIIYNNLPPSEMVSSVKMNKYFKNTNKNFLKLEIGEIHLGKGSKKEIIPLGMTIIDWVSEKYIGMIRVSILTDDIIGKFINIPYYKLKLINQSNIECSKYRDQISKINILKSYFKKEPLILVEPLVHYPISVQLEINSAYFGKEIILMILYCFGYFCAFIALTYILLISYKKKYQKLFYDINQKALDLQLKITPNIICEDNKPQAKKLNDFCPNDLVKAMESIIDYCNLLYTNAEKQTLKQSLMELHNSILQVILTERHYHPSNKNSKTDVSALYLEQLRRIINEKDQAIILPVFLRDTIEYCSVYYNDLNIKIQISKKDHKAFVFKQAALTEAIFHIFSLITRIGKFDTDNEEVVVSASFIDRNLVPTINIEVNLCNSSIQSIGWELGTNYVYSGLLSIYLLAKENNLFFHLEQKKQKIIFILEPIDNQRLKNINGDLMNLNLDSPK